MIAHTSGPWVAHNTGEHVFTIKATSVHINASANEKERSYYQGIASVTERGNHPQHGGGISFKTCQANARLIAAAPELLEALKSVRMWMEDQADGQSKGGHATFDLMALREQRDIAEAAITKATGGAA
jgi:hypothetical protein